MWVHDLELVVPRRELEAHRESALNVAGRTPDRLPLGPDDVDPGLLHTLGDLLRAIGLEQDGAAELDQAAAGRVVERASRRSGRGSEPNVGINGCVGAGRRPSIGRRADERGLMITAAAAAQRQRRERAKHDRAGADPVV